MRKVLLFVFVLLFQNLSFGQDEELARTYFEQGEFDKSLGLYLEIYKRERSKPHFNRVVENYKALDELKKAEKFTEKHIKEISGTSDYFIVQLGVIRKLRGDLEGADEAFEIVLSSIDKSPGKVYPVARIFENNQLYNQALDAYERAEAQSPNLSFHYQKAQLYGELGDIESVFREILLLVEENPAYINTVRQLASQSLSDDPEDPTNVYLKEQLLKRIQASNDPTFTELLTWVFIKERNFKGAFRQLKALDMRLDKKQHELFDFADICMKNEEFQVAEDVYDYIIEKGNISPLYTEAEIGRLEAKRALLFSNPPVKKEAVALLSGEYAKVLAALPQQINAAPAYRSWYRLKAFHLGDTIVAIKGLEELKTWPDQDRQELDETLLALGDVLTFSGRYYEAILYYAQVEKARPGTDLADRAKFSRARVAYYKGEFDWAENLFEALKFSVSKLIANDAMEYSILIRDNVGLDTNTEALSMYSKAELLMYRKKYSEALKTLELMKIAFYEHSLQDEVLWMSANIYVEMDSLSKAEVELTTLLQKHDNDILADNALMLLGQIKEKNGDEEKAQEIYQKLLTDHPDSFYTSEARKRIRRLRGDVPM